MEGLRYTPNAFKHNGRMAVVLLPAVILLVGFGGKLPAGVLMAGAMVRASCLQRSREDLLC
jgi:hypothetical protein